LIDTASTTEVYSVGLSLQRKLELAGELAKVQPLLLRLHLIEKPKKRNPVRTLIVVGSVIALVAVVATVVFGRKRSRPSGPADLQGFTQPDTAAETSEARSASGAPDEPSAETPA
jgi:hypothetical protein